MKIRHLLIALAIASVGASAAAETKTPAPEMKKPVTQWTCKEFIALADQYKPNVVYWASAYAKGGKPEASELDIEGTETVTPIVIQDCEKQPKASFWQKLKGAWAKVEHKAKSETTKMEKKL